MITSCKNWLKQVKTQKSTNNPISHFDLIEENMELSHIHLAVMFCISKHERVLKKPTWIVMKFEKTFGVIRFLYVCSDSYSLFWALFASVCQSDLLQLMRVSKHFLWRCPIKVDGHQSERNDSLGWWQKADWFLLHKNKLFCLTCKKKKKSKIKD